MVRAIVLAMVVGMVGCGGVEAVAPLPPDLNGAALNGDGGRDPNDACHTACIDESKVCQSHCAPGYGYDAGLEFNACLIQCCTVMGECFKHCP